LCGTKGGTVEEEETHLVQAVNEFLQRGRRNVNRVSQVQSGSRGIRTEEGKSSTYSGQHRILISSDLGDTLRERGQVDSQLVGLRPCSDVAVVLLVIVDDGVLVGDLPEAGG
jgi:hypothetical protein